MKITIDKHGRVWTQITVHYASGRDGKAKIKKSFVDSFKPGEETEIEGYIDRHENGYGSDPELVPQSHENAKQREIDRYWGFVQKDAKRGYIKDANIEKLHSLGCYEHDEEIQLLKYGFESKRWWEYFQNSLKQGYIYERAVAELHKIGCHEHDDEIAAARDKIAAAKQAKKYERETATSITTLNLPAQSFNDRKRPGEKFLHKGKVYETISSFYHDGDGFSFGVMSETWQTVKVKDVTNTEFGRKLLEQQDRDALRAKMVTTYNNALENLRHAMCSHGFLYEGEEIGLDEIPGITILDTFDMYGGGDIVRLDTDASKLWFVQNNGADGDDWSINNIRTGGAGAVAFTADVVDIATELGCFEAANKALKETSKVTI